MSTTAAQLDVQRQAALSPTQPRDLSAGHESNRPSGTRRADTQFPRENASSISTTNFTANSQGSSSIPPQPPGAGSSRSQGQGGYSERGGGDDDEETQRPPPSQSVSESQEPTSIPATSTSENVWDYSIPVPGSKKGNVIYPKAPVELSPWTRDQWRSRFLFIKSELESLVYRHLRLLVMESRPVYSAHMVGTCPTNARPSVVVTCREVDAKNIRNLFRSRAQDQLCLRQDSESSAHLSTMSHLRSSLRIRREPTNESSTVPPLQLVYYQIPTPTVIRNALETPLFASIDTNRATCGAMIQFNGTCATLGVGVDLGLDSLSVAFMTVDHLFSTSTSEPEYAAHSSEFLQLDTSRDSSDSIFMDLDHESPNGLWNDDDEYDDDGGTDNPMQLDHDASIEMSYKLEEQAGDALPNIQGGLLLDQQEDEELWERISPPNPFSIETPYLDWALARPSLQASQLSLSLINTIFPDGPERCAVVLTEFERSPPSHLAPVYIVSGVRGIIHGQIITAPSFLPSSRPEQRSFEAWTVILDDKNGILPGECGSVVVNRATNRIHGHVVGSDALGHAYIVPMMHIFDQIDTCFKGVAAPARLKAPGKSGDGATILPAAKQHAFVNTHAASRPLNISEFEDYNEPGFEDFFLNAKGDMVTLSQMAFETLGKDVSSSSSSQHEKPSRSA